VHLDEKSQEQTADQFQELHPGLSPGVLGEGSLD
jgi:hypothetical protein